MHRVHINRNLRTYNQQAIDAWKQELAVIPHEIAQKEKNIRDHQSQLDIYQPQLEQLRAVSILPLEKQIHLEQAKINVLKIPCILDDLREKLVPYNSRLAVIKIELSTVTESVNAFRNEINQLKTMIKIIEAKEEQKKYKDEVDRSAEQINRLQDELQKEIIHKNELETRRNAEQCNLNNLRADVSVSKDTVSHLFLSQITAFQNTIAGYAASLETCKASIEGLNKKITSHQDKMAGAQKKLQQNKISIVYLERQMVNKSYFTANVASLQEDIAKKRREMRPHEVKQSELASKQNEIEKHVATQQSEIESQEKELRLSQTLVGDLVLGESISKIQARLDSLKLKRSELGKEETRLNEIISGYQNSKCSELAAIENKKSRLKDLFSNTFLMSLTEHPHTLLTTLYTSLRRALENYEETHPSNQPENVRLCLAEITSKLHYLQAPGFADENARQKYYILCGFLWKMLDKADGGLDVSLAEMIMDLLRKNPVDQDEAKGAYSALCAVYPATFADLLLGDYLRMQCDAYTKAVNDLSIELKKLPTNLGSLVSLRRHGYDLLQSIIELKDQLEQHEQKFDEKFYTEVLRLAIKLVQNRCDEISLKKFHHFIEANKDGASSGVKKVSGSMFMLAGISAVAAGFAWPKTADYIPVPAVFAGGGLSFLLGAGIFGSGMQKSTSRTMTRFEQSVKMDI